MLIVYITLCCATLMNAQPGCLSDRAKENRNKRVPLHHTVCYCECDRYPHSLRRDRCARCDHYHAPQALPTQHARPSKEPWELVCLNARNLPR